MLGTNVARIAVRPQPRPGLVPRDVALGHEPRGVGACREVRAGEQVAAVLVRVADDEHGVAAGPQDALDLAQDAAHRVEVRRVVGQVGEVRAEVAAPSRSPSAGWRAPRRACRRPSSSAAGRCTAGRWRRSRRSRPGSPGSSVARVPWRISSPDGSNAADAARVLRAEIGEDRPGAVALGARAPRRSRDTRRPSARRAPGRWPAADRARSPRRGACRRRPRTGRARARPIWVKNSIRRAMSRGGLFAPWALRRWWPSSDGYAVVHTDFVKYSHSSPDSSFRSLAGWGGRRSCTHGAGYRPRRVAAGRGPSVPTRARRPYNQAMPGRVVSRRFIGRERGPRAGRRRHRRRRRAARRRPSSSRAARAWARAGSSTRSSSAPRARPSRR